MEEIGGIKRALNAEESARRFFQTTSLIVSHFRREGDRKNIYAICPERSTLSRLLAASAAVHCYHYVGIKTRNYTRLTDSYSSDTFENMEKKDLYKEIVKLINDVVSVDIELALHVLKYQKQILDVMREGERELSEDFKRRLKDELEVHLVSALNKYPGVSIYDHIGDLTGFSLHAKNHILRESRKLKATSLDLEQSLLSKTYSDKYIELSSFSYMVERLKAVFEFNSIKDLKMEMFPIRKILNGIVRYQSELFPISRIGLEAYSSALEMKHRIYKAFREANVTPIVYVEFEDSLREEIKERLEDCFHKHDAVYVSYYLQFLLDMKFDELNLNLKHMGIEDMDTLCRLAKKNYKEFMREVGLFSISRMDAIQLNRKDNLIERVEHTLNKLKRERRAYTSKNLMQILKDQEKYELEYIKEACERCGVKYDDLISLAQKKQLLEEYFWGKYAIKNYSELVGLFDFEEILTNLSRFIYFSFIGKISRQVARVTETYVKLKDDKALFLLALQKTKDSASGVPLEKWVVVKIEELIIHKLQEAEEELSIIFNMHDDWEGVNSFILARLIDTTMDAALEMLVEEASPLYEPIKELPLPRDIVSPVSYIVSYDLLGRFKDSIETRVLEKEQLIEEKERREQEKKKEIQKAKQYMTLNWIEKKVSSSLMSITTKINPASLYWTEKDNRICAENIVSHCSLKDRFICPVCYGDLVEDKGKYVCREHEKEGRPATPFDLIVQYYYFTINSIKKRAKVSKMPSLSDIEEEVEEAIRSALRKRIGNMDPRKDSLHMLSGEKRAVAVNIAHSIGQLLDKAIYKTFKRTLKKGH